jgi:hypothetical protein
MAGFNLRIQPSVKRQIGLARVDLDPVEFVDEPAGDFDRDRDRLGERVTIFSGRRGQVDGGGEIPRRLRDDLAGCRPVCSDRLIDASARRAR